MGESTPFSSVECLSCSVNGLSENRTWLVQPPTLPAGSKQLCMRSPICELQTFI